ncbi:uncharacterized protein LOC143369548 isoform X2 [Andrena cerasifolii]|uniref:uncharacterized protein LOC143369548 isoform X2 n=1 Tax=Andrena cerasifolii TaxID=2819439 RepID=UPI004037A2D2
MNVVRNEKLFQPPRERNGAGAGAGARIREQFAVPSLTKYQLECDKRLRKQWKTPSYRGGGRGRASTTTSTTFLPSSSRNYVSRSGTRSTAGPSSNALETGGNVLAITTGRGEARTEVGMAAMDIRCPYLILCQISDSQTYASALSKLYLFDPAEVLMPDTMCERATSRNVLYRSIVNKFSNLRLTPISRIHFNDTNGLERIRTLCAPEYSSVELFVKEKSGKRAKLGISSVAMRSTKR